LKAYNGLTVEVVNTDAEGRLVMADVMTYIQRTFNPKKVLYIATLTGAVGTALGTTTAGFFTPHDDMVKDLLKAGEDSFEPVWQMPLLESHREVISGAFGADISNRATKNHPYGGSSNAAAFLERFIENDRPWAHIDIANTGFFMEKDMSGFGAKLLLKFIDQL